MKKNFGFTLVEIVIVIVIAGIIAGTAGFMLNGTVKAWIFKFNRNDILWDGKLALNRMIREMMAIKNSTSIITATSSQFRFINSLDKDIIYSLNGSNLNRSENGAANLLAENVASLIFSYYDAGGNVIAIPAISPSATNVRRVRINLTLVKNGQNIYLQSDVSSRNF